MKKNQDWDLIISNERNIFDFKLHEIWEFKDLLFLFVKRDFTTFYKQTILGPLWFFIQPILTSFVYLFIFSRVAGISTDKVPPYLFYLCGIICWNYFSNNINSTSTIFFTNAGIFGKVYFPRLIPPISNIISNFFRFTLQLIMFLFFYFYFLSNDFDNIKPSSNMLLFLPIVIMQVTILSFGIGMIISSLTSKYRDLGYLTSFGLQLLMYASPIIYPLSSVPVKYKNFIYANPMSSAIEGFRKGFLGVGEFNLNLFTYSLTFSIFIFLTGLIIFKKVEKNFIDTI